MYRPLLASAVLAVVLAGCGGGETKTVTVGAAPAASTSSAPATTTAPAPSPDEEAAAAKRIARDAVLRLTDLPSGWEEQDDDSDDDGDGGRSTCPAAVRARDEAVARKSSNAFSNDDSFARSDVLIFADEDAADEQFDALTSADSRRCVVAAIGGQAKERAKDGATVGKGRGSVVNSDPLGDDTGTIRVTLPVTYYGVDSDLAVDLTFTRIDRGITLTTTQGIDDEDLSRDIVTAAARRLRDAY